MLSLSSSAAISFSSPPAAVFSGRHVAASPVMESKADLMELASAANPIIGFYDPLGLADGDGSSTMSNEQWIGFLRQSEIKHGRVAMAAFVGFIVQSNGICFPWGLTSSGVTFSDIASAGGPADQWDALPTASKLAIYGGVGFLEIYGEFFKALEADGEKHYMRGGTPGKYPSLKAGYEAGLLPHPVPLDLWDPFGFTKKMTPERKAKALVAEINNGRLAMFGIMSFFAAQKLPGSVPALTTVAIKPYAGEVMAPFTAADAALPVVSEMLKYSPF